MSAKLSRAECVANLKKKGYTDGEIDVWVAGYDYGCYDTGNHRSKLRELISEGDFDFTKIFCEIECEGDIYATLSDEGLDKLTEYILELFNVLKEGM